MTKSNFRINCDKYPADYCVIFYDSEVISVFNFVVGYLRVMRVVRYFMSRIIIIIFALIIQGCVAIHYFPSTTNSKISTFPTKEEYAVCVPNNAKTNITTHDIMKYYGKPDKNYEKDGYAYLEYYQGKIWSGIYIQVLIVPIPLALPIKKQSCTYTIANDYLVKTERISTKESIGFWCGLLADAGASNGRFGCERILDSLIKE